MAPVCSAAAAVPPAAPGVDPPPTPAIRPRAVSDHDSPVAPPAVVDQPPACPSPRRNPGGRGGVDEPIRDNPLPPHKGSHSVSEMPSPQGTEGAICEHPPPPSAAPGSRPTPSPARPEHVPVEPVKDNPSSTHEALPEKTPLLPGTEEKPKNPPPPAAQEVPPVGPHPLRRDHPHGRIEPIIQEPIPDNPPGH